MEDPFPVGVAFDSNSKSAVFGFGRDPTIRIWEKQEHFLKRQFEMKIGVGGLGGKLNPSSKGYKTFFLVLGKKKGERINEIFKKYRGEGHGTIIINSIKEKKIRNSFRPYFIDEPCKQIILTFGKEKKDREKEPFDHGPLLELQDSKVTLKLFNELLKDLLENIQRKSDKNQEVWNFLENFQRKSDKNQEVWNFLENFQRKSDKNQDWNIFFENNFENIIYDKEIIGLDSLSVVPEIKNEINIDLTEEEYLDSIKGTHFEDVTSKDDINAAKAEILKAIEEIAKKEHVELKNKTKEELANLSIILLKKIGKGI